MPQPSEADRSVLYFRTVIRSALRGCNAAKANHLSESTIESLAMQAANAVHLALADDAATRADDAASPPEWMQALLAPRGKEPA